MPTHVIVNDQNELIISDTGNYRVRKVSNNGTIETLVGLGHVGFSDDGSVATESKLQGPRGLLLYNNSLYIADQKRVRIMSLGCDSGYQLSQDKTVCLPFCYGKLANSDNVCSGGKCVGFGCYLFEKLVFVSPMTGVLVIHYTLEENVN